MENAKPANKKPHALFRMLKYLKDHDPKIIGLFVVYTLCASISPRGGSRVSKILDFAAIGG